MFNIILFVNLPSEHTGNMPGVDSAFYTICRNSMSNHADYLCIKAYHLSQGSTVVQMLKDIF